MINQKKPKKVIKAIKVILTLAIFFFLSKFIINNIDQLNETKFDFNIANLALSSFIYCVFLIAQYFLWHLITIVNKCNISIFNAIYFKSISSFGKYVPGKIFSYAILLNSYTGEKKSKKSISLCIFIELISSLLGAIAVFLTFILFIQTPFQKEINFFSIFLLLFLGILIHPRIMKFLSNKFFSLIKQSPPNVFISSTQILKITLLYYLNWVLFSFSFFLFLNSFYKLSFQYFFFSSAAVIISGIIGFFSFFVPAGLGVREGVLSVTLAKIIPEFYAGIISIASRLWLSLGEVLIFLFVFLLKRKMEKK